MELNTTLLRHIVDVSIVSWLIYRGLLIVRGTRAVPMIAGLAAAVLLYFAANGLGLITLSWLLSAFLSSIILVIVVIFQDEIRRGLVKVGLNPLIRKTRNTSTNKVLEDITLACSRLAKSKIGMLLVIQRDIGLDNFLEEAVLLDAIVSRKLIISIFQKDSPLHDGALIVEGDRIKAAGCVLPLSADPNLDPNLGTRHRAALGISEKSDAVVVVVSEQTGNISIAYEGKIIRNLEPSGVKDFVEKIFPVNGGGKS